MARDPPLGNSPSSRSRRPGYSLAEVTWARGYCYSHASTAVSYNNLGTVYNSQGKHEESLGALSKVLDIQLKVLGPEHPDVATSYNNLRAVYDDQGK